MRKIRAIIGVISIMCILLNGCSAKVGNKKDSLIIYTSHSSAMTEEIVKRFEKKYNTYVSLVKIGTGEAIQRIKEENEAPLADLLWGGSATIYYENADLWQNYISANDKACNEKYRNSDNICTRFSVVPCVLIVNTNLLNGLEVKGYNDLLNPALKGKIAMCNPRKSSSAFESSINMLYAMGNGQPDNGWNYMEQFLMNCNGDIQGSSSSVYKRVNNGEYAVGVSYEGVAENLNPDGSVKLVYPEEGTVANADGIAIIKNAKQTKLAEKFVDFVTSQEIQTYISKNCYRRSVRDDVKSEVFEDISTIKTLNIDLNYISEHEDDILNRFDQINDAVVISK